MYCIGDGAGVHPTRCGEFEKSGDAQAYLVSMNHFRFDGSDLALPECATDCWTVVMDAHVLDVLFGCGVVHSD